MSCDCNNNIDSSQGNPCTPCPTESANCETLPSALENFILNFFGSVERSVVNGKVVWTLPCNLATGLVANPRGTNEGLACYFLRLFEDGIIGLQGETGDQGEPGTAGFNAFSVLTCDAVQPSTTSPNWTIKIFRNPVFVAGQVVFINGSGWSRVTLVSNDVLSLTLLEATGSAGATIPAGTLISVAGPRGLPGTATAKGDPGEDAPALFPATIKNPTATEDFTLGFNFVERTISEIRAVIRGSSTPSVSWTLKFGTDRAGAGTEVITGGKTTLNINGGDSITAFNNAVLPAGVWVWLETSSTGGTVEEFNLTVRV